MLTYKCTNTQYGLAVANVFLKGGFRRITFYLVCVRTLAILQLLEYLKNYWTNLKYFYYKEFLIW